MNNIMYDVLADRVSILSNEDGAIRAEFTLPSDFPPLNGHFPGQPILPGIAQISLVTGILNKAFSKSFTLATVKRIKFLSPAEPGMKLAVSIQFDHGNANAEITADDKRISSMKLIYSPEAV